MAVKLQYTYTQMTQNVLLQLIQMLRLYIYALNQTEAICFAFCLPHTTQNSIFLKSVSADFMHVQTLDDC